MDKSFLLVVIFAGFIYVSGEKSENKDSDIGWGSKRNKPPKEKRAGGAKLGLFKKGAAFEMDRKNKAIRFEIVDLLETKLDNTKKKYKVNEIDFDVSREGNDSSYGVPSQLTTLSGNLSNNANISVSLIIFRENGTVITDDGYEFDVVEGTLKFNLDLNWPYEVKSIDPTLGLKCFHGKIGKKGKKGKGHKGKKSSKSKGTRPPETFGFCESVRVTFSTTYKQNNSSWLDMPTGYPIVKMSEGSGWSKITLRFNGTKVSYDPITEVGDDVYVDVESSGQIVTPSLLALLVVFISSFQKV